MNRYEERKQRKIEYYEEKAAQAAAESNQLVESSIGMLSGIPAGQPILVGHHSEKGARALREKSDGKMRKGVEERDKAEYYAKKAAAIANNKAIHSDDPEAMNKLTEKLERMEAAHKDMVKQNAYYRKHGTMVGYSGMSDESAREKDMRIERDYSWNKQPYPSYALQNHSAEIRRLKNRLKEMEKIGQVSEDDGWDFPGGEVVINKEIGRIQICFDERVSKEDYNTLRSNAFLKTRDRKNIIFQRKLTANALYAVKRIAFIQPDKEEEAI